MTKLEVIEKQIASLDPQDLKKLDEWFEEYKSDLWDKQIEEDSRTGKLDKLFAEAKAEIAAGKVRPL